MRLLNRVSIIKVSIIVNIRFSHRSPAPVSGSGVAEAAAFLALMVVTLPKMCNKMTQPM